MSDHKTSVASPSATSSQASPDGRLPCDSPGSRTISRCGRVVLRASLSAWLEQASGQEIHVTWLRPFSISSQSVVLQCSSASRLQRQLKKTTGLTLYSLSWKRKVTPAQRMYCQLQASALRTNATDYFSRPFAWTTPSHSDGRRGWSGITANMTGSSLAQQAKMTSWHTAIANDAKGSDYSTSAGRKILKLGGEAKLAIWPTSSATDHKGGYQGGRIRNGKLSVDRLDVAAQLVMPDCPVRITETGEVLTGSSAGMDASGPLNPEHSRWLMGYPAAWGYSKDMVTPSYLKSLPGSSAQLLSQLMRLNEAIYRNRLAWEQFNAISS
ncbi:hypothetical protein [Cronobacter phage JC01]|uniref:Uncharacterized protein n=1 Tax=Cronobacter phage JC01 TaxID=2729575 RepID=A0A6M3YNQ4_9CAUD|nr:DNA methyltransferase [Cronobacter phage JC01]QJI52275.1 hypothetical protein [Cronobacter phage JC01]